MNFYKLKVRSTFTSIDAVEDYLFVTEGYSDASVKKIINKY